jgi:hypothetical protein
MGETCRESSNAFGLLANMPQNRDPAATGVLSKGAPTPQANILSSLDCSIMAFWRRTNALSPSPYSNGMFTSKISSNEYAVSSFPSGLSTRGPAHALRYPRGKNFIAPRNVGDVDASGFRNLPNKSCSIAGIHSRTVVEPHVRSWSQQLLERPASCKLAAPTEFILPDPIVNVTLGDVVEEDITLFGFLIPSVHAVDSFAEFGTAVFIDAAGIDPDPLQSRFSSNWTAVLNLPPSVEHRRPWCV